MLNIEALEQALASIEAVGHEELTFQVGGDEGVTVTLCLVAPEEEVEVQRYAQEAIDAGEDGNAAKDAAMEFLDRWKYGLLSYAIVQIDNLDFRDVEYVETGETLDNGKAIRKPKHVVVRNLIRKLWKRPILNRVFHKYTELQERAESKAEKVIEYTPSELGAEIERLEERLAALKAEQEAQQQAKEDPVSAQIRGTNRMAAQDASLDAATPPREIAKGENRAARRKREQEERRAQKKAPQPPEEPEPPAPSRRSALPTRGAAPSRGAPAPAPTPAPAPRTPDVFGSSFADGDDEAVIAAETQRILAARRAAAEAEAEGTNVPGPEHQARVDEAARQRALHAGGNVRQPPHRQAASTQAAVLDSGGNEIKPVRPEHVGSVDGVEAHRIRETETLSRRGQPSKPKPRGKGDKPPVNQPPGGGSTNPNFRPPGR